jgi:signal transduction histidine kinase
MEARLIERWGTRGGTPIRRFWSERSSRAENAADPDRRHSLDGYGALWLLLAIASVAVVVAPDPPVAVRNAPLALAIAVFNAAVGLALLQVGLQRFGIFGRPLDLCAGLAFGTLALADLLARLLPSLAGGGASERATSLALLLLIRLVAVGLVLGGLCYPHSTVKPGARAGLAVRLGAILGATAAAGAAAVLTRPGWLPSGIGEGGRGLPDASWLLAGNGLIAVALLVANVGCAAVSRRLTDPHVGPIRISLMMLFLAQAHALLVVPVEGGDVGSGDVLRLAAYLVLLVGLAARLPGEIAASAASAERLRLSRELHDGLAQQLALLHLRLCQAAAPDRPAERREHDLAAAHWLVEAALLEARQSIVALRTGRVPWTEFVEAMRAIGDEFAENLGLAIDTLGDAEGPTLEAELRVDLLRIAHEAFSNALRHGRATRAEVALRARPDRLEMHVRDNGRGFGPEPNPGRDGVGLRSARERIEQRGGVLAIGSAPDGGAVLSIVLPLTPWRRLSPGRAAR